MSKKIKTGLVHLQFWCKTSVIDKMVSDKKGLVWNDTLANAMEEKSRHYFIIDKKNNVAVVSHLEIEKFEVINGEKVYKPLDNCEITSEIQTVIDKWIKEVHKV